MIKIDEYIKIDKFDQDEIYLKIKEQQDISKFNLES